MQDIGLLLTAITTNWEGNSGQELETSSSQKRYPAPMPVFFFLLQGMLTVKWIIHTLATMHNPFSSRAVHLNMKRSRVWTMAAAWLFGILFGKLTNPSFSLKVFPQWSCQHGEEIQNICLSKWNQVVLRDKAAPLFLRSSCLRLESSFMDTERGRRLLLIKMIKMQTFKFLFLRSALHCQQLQNRHKEQRTCKILKRGS